jgi:hypothetical protein
MSRALARRQFAALRICFLSVFALLGGTLSVPAWSTIAFVQGHGNFTYGTNTVSATFVSAQTAGNFNVISIGWADSTTIVNGVTDSRGNVYSLAVGPTRNTGNATQYIYYAKNIVSASAGANTVTVTLSAASVTWPELRIAEYSGIDTSNPFDGAVGNSGSSSTSSSGNLTTTNANDLLVGVNYVQGTTSGPGSGYTQRYIIHGNILQDRTTTTTGTYSATAPFSPSGWWVMQVAAFKAAVSDTTAPSAPAGLGATVISSSQINLSWSASTDNVAVTGYRVERCQGAGCSTFAEVGAPSGTSFNDTGLAASTSYTYRIRASDAVPNLSAPSSTASATTSAVPVAFVQGTTAAPGGSVSSIAATFANAQNAGDLNVVVIGFSNGTRTVQSISDSRGNAYALAVGPTTNSARQAIYYAKNILSAGAGANTVTVSLSGSSAYVDLRIAEYSGIDTANPLDVTVAGTGTSTSANSGSVTTTSANNLLVGAAYSGATVTGAGGGYTQRLSSFNTNNLQDRIVTTTGSYNATASVSPSVFWIMQFAAFKAALDTQAPNAPSGLSASTASSSQINLTWTASTDNVGVTGYRVERCQGVGCSSFTQVGTAVGTAYSDIGLSPSTSYTYRVLANDAVPNVSGPSNTASATTQAGSDAIAPSSPSELMVIAASSNEIDIVWSASTDNVGVTGYIVERCEGAGCASWVSVGTPTDTRFNDGGRNPSTSYSYRVIARDAANNPSGPSPVVTYVTPASSPDCN